MTKYQEDETMKSIQVTQSSMPDFNEFCLEISDLWDSRWLTNMGVKHNQLEAELKKYLRTPNVTLFSNGHLALENAIAAFDLTGEVITTPFTFASTTHAIVRNGLTPVFCDINPDDYTIQTDNLERLITEKTTAIIPVHVYGNICNVREIERIAKKYNLKVIYDAAHAFGITVNGENVANFGDASMFSFHATKVFHTIEGGALTFSDTSLEKVLNSYKNFGLTESNSVEYVGGNAKMNEFQAAMGLCNLKIIEQEISKRKNVYEKYLDNFSNIKGIKLTPPLENVKSNYAYLPILFDGFSLTRDEVDYELRKQNVIPRKYFSPLTNSFECYKGRFNSTETPVAEYIAKNILTLPLYSDLKMEEVDKICSVIKTHMTIKS